MKHLYFAISVLACFFSGWNLAAYLESKKPPKRKKKVAPANSMHLDLDFTQFESKK